MAKGSSHFISVVAVLILLVGVSAFLLLIGLAFGLNVLLLSMAALAAACVGYLVWQVDPAYTLSAAIFLSPMAGNWQQVGLPSGVDPDRLLLVAGILQILFRAPAVRDRPRFRLEPAHAFLVLAVVYALASAFAAGTLFSKDPLFKIIDAFGILPFLTFFTAPLAFRTSRQRRILVMTLVVLGAYLGVTALAETVHLNALVFPKYILNPNYGLHYGRARGPFVDAVANGFATYVCAVACGVAIASWRQRWARVAAALVGILCLLGSFLSLERSVWIGVAVASVITMLTSRRLRPYLLLVVAGIAIVVIGALTFVPGLQQTVNARVNQIGTVWDRENLTVAGINMIEARPLTGFGWGRFQAESQLFFRQSQNYPLTATQNGIHNFVLLYAVELGVPGLVLWGLGLLTGVGSALLTRGPPDLAPWRTGLIAVFVMFLVVANSVPPSLFPNLSLWLVAGVAFSGRYGDAVHPRVAISRRTESEAECGTTRLSDIRVTSPR
jgi:putative inorganic carbon (hco3(-)) transporter